MRAHPIHQYQGKSATPALRGKALLVRPQEQWYASNGFLEPEEVGLILDGLGPFSRAAVADGEVSETPLPVDGFGWLYDALWHGMKQAGRRWGLDVTGMYEEAVVLRYGVKDTNGWHSDYDEVDRSKVALTILLDDRSQWEGGDLELLRNDIPRLSKAGDACFFSAYLAHRVTPVTAGTRTALVAWAGGPALR